MVELRRLRSQFRRASMELGIEVREDHEVRLSAAPAVVVPIFVPKFGAEKGTLVVSDFDEIKGCADELVRAGYGYCVLDEPRAGEDYAQDVFVDILSDWGWAGAESERPLWLASGLRA